MKKEILYHYTSIASMNSIIRSGKVWATDCRYLNDEKELKDAVNMFLERHEGLKKEALTSAFHWHSNSRAPCVFALSRSPKVVSQWRAYADDGKGAAIGFDRKFLRPASSGPSQAIVDCIYENHQEFILNLSREYKAEINDIVETYKFDSAINVFWKNIDKSPEPLEKLYSELLRIKNPAFSEEQEVRLVVNIPLDSIVTRVSNGLIIPYFEHKYADDEEKSSLWRILPEIWFGPKSDKRNMQSILVFQQAGWIDNGIYRYD